jgi:hypothetical protein
MDMTGGYAASVRAHAPQTTIVIDNYHVVQVRHEALPVRAGCETPPPGCRGSPGASVLVTWEPLPITGLGRMCAASLSKPAQNY